MFLITIYRILKTSVFSLWRNRWLSLAATLIMVLTLFTISFFVSLLLIINKTTVVLKDKVDIAVYFNESASNDQIFAIQNIMLSRSDVKSAEYISKEQALERWQLRNQDNEKIRDIVTEIFNPLPRSLEIKTDKPEDLAKINDFLSSADYKPLVKEISYLKNKSLIDRLIDITSFVEYIGWVLSLIFVLISILIIYNTIRLTIYARSEEIEIMKLVGANDYYIQGPFILEGAAYGIVGAIFSSIILLLALRIILPAAETYLGLDNAQKIFSGASFSFIVVFQLLVGLLLGVGCSVFAVRKYLNK